MVFFEVYQVGRSDYLEVSMVRVVFFEDEMTVRTNMGVFVSGVELRIATDTSYDHLRKHPHFPH
jgi:hypothetical protein